MFLSLSVLVMLTFHNYYFLFLVIIGQLQTGLCLITIIEMTSWIVCYMHTIRHFGHIGRQLCTSQLVILPNSGNNVLYGIRDAMTNSIRSSTCFSTFSSSFQSTTNYLTLIVVIYNPQSN